MSLLVRCAFVTILVLSASFCSAETVFKEIPVGVSLFSPIDSNPEDINVIHNFELNLIYGKSYGLKGLAISAGLNRWDGFAHGVQISGVGNIVGAPSHAYQVSGFFNYAADLTGAQVSGVFNRAGSLTGVQVSSLFNQAASSTGAQITGFYNGASKLEGVQVSGIYNYAESVVGVQNSGLYNEIKGNLKGLQIAPINKAGNVLGAQSGTINIAGDVLGIQVGLINIADSNPYGQFGLVNIDFSKSYKIVLGVGDSTNLGSFALRSEGAWSYNNTGLIRRENTDDKYANDMSLFIENGIYKTLGILTISLGARFDSLEIKRVPYAAVAGISVSVINRFAIFSQYVKSYSNSWKPVEAEFESGIQYTLKERG